MDNDTTLLRVADTACGWCGQPVPEPVYLTLVPGRYVHQVDGTVASKDPPVRRAYCTIEHASAHATWVAECETYHQRRETWDEDDECDPQ